MLIEIFGVDLDVSPCQAVIVQITTDDVRTFDIDVTLANYKTKCISSSNVRAVVLLPAIAKIRTSLVSAKTTAFSII